MQATIWLADETATLDFGASWAKSLRAPLIIYLNGTLGAGKTTFARGLLRGLGYSGAVKSPTYALVESYLFADYQIHHFDLYRFTSPEEWQDAGLDDLMGAGCIALIEWAEQGGDYVPAADICLDFAAQDAGRQCHVRALTARGESVVATWKN